MQVVICLTLRNRIFNDCIEYRRVSGRHSGLDSHKFTTLLLKYAFGSVVELKICWFNEFGLLGVKAQKDWGALRLF